MTEARPLLEVTDLKKHYPVRSGLLRRTVGKVHSVDGVSFAIGVGETLGMIGPKLSVPAVQLLHGAEVAIPGRLPLSSKEMQRLLRGSAGVIAAGPYPEAEARRAARGSLPPVLQLPPGVDVERFVPLAPEARRAARAALGLQTRTS